ncbi:MAG: NADH-quinone oxidoreductase subunit J [Dehalococcoidia bacterium]|nr:MAG: NADH-quinone oxidoreductase subunit J [Dehalococcoidia bacterium]
MGLEIAFWILAVVTIISALAVVWLRNIFRAALSLILCFLSVAGIFVTLSADFLAAIQILIYVGAVAILIILAIMLTKEVEKGSLSNKLKIPVIVTTVLFLGVAIYAVINTSWSVVTLLPQEPTTAALANELFGRNGFVLAVEISAVMLLAAIIGAVTLMREE